MYIHRIVIDADRINTRGGIAAMNCLEAFHDAGLVEILQTSTLPVEFLKWPRGQRKARRYDVIGGSNMVYVTNSNIADSRLGTSGRESRFMEIHRVVFGEPASDEEKRKHDMRDALHIDQASQHDADYFITCDGVILDAAPKLVAIGIGTRVCTAENCVAEIAAYFIRHYGTSEPSALAQRLSQEGPIFLGSNSCGGIAITDVESGEELLALWLSDSGVAIRTIIRGQDGGRLLTVIPGKPFVFEGPGPSIRMEVGPAPLLVGDKHCRSFAVTSSGNPLFAGRVLRSGRLLVHDVSLYNKSGLLAVCVVRDALEVAGVTFSEVLAP
jgi:hypothetical protein